jgi:PAS domain-containing protein
LEKKTIYLTEIPSDYLFITSGLGSANPRSLLIVPMMINEEVQGIIEIASFNVYKPYEIEFVEKLAQSVAAIVSNIRTEENTRYLLGQSQQQTEQMQAQEEEMRQNMEELQATQEEMARKEKELAKLLEQSNTNKTELEFRLKEIERFKEENQKMLDSAEKNKKDVIEILNQIPAKIFLKDSKGYMVLCNAQLAKVYDLSIDQLIGTHDYDHFERSLAQSYFEKEQEIIRTGAQTYIQEERLTGELQYLQTTKMPFFIHQLNEVGLLGYQFDVTKVHSAESIQRELNEQVAKLKQEIAVLKEKLSK